MMSRRYYRIEVVSELLELPRSQIRRYEQEGLISPSAEAGGDGQQRFYTEEDLRRLRRLRRLQRDLGLNLAGLQVAVRLLDQIEDLQRRLGERG
jgi:MerR family transcriptional regulator, heat shock protein HspR